MRTVELPSFSLPGAVLCEAVRNLRRERASGRGIEGCMTLEERFWPKVDRSGGPEACWPWTGSTDRYGYGRTKVDGKVEKAPRVAWSLANGPVPVGACVCHSCDTPRCVNPAHLWAGSRKQNSEDMAVKGRAPRAWGSANHYAKLTEPQVEAMRAEYAAGAVSQRDLARKYAVGKSTVARILIGQRWQGLPA